LFFLRFNCRLRPQFHSQDIPMIGGFSLVHFSFSSRRFRRRKTSRPSRALDTLNV
jgi:hypothetical protein